MIFRNKKLILFVVLVLLITIPLSFMVVNKIAPLAWNPFGRVHAYEGVAIYGYDPVAYHIQNKAQIGNKDHAHVWSGFNWYFISDENRKRFVQDPSTYAPKFGGYCATAVYKGLTAKVDPNIWHIENGELFLFFSEEPKRDFVSKISEGIIEESKNNWAASED